MARIDDPYSTGIFETIINCHFGGIYLVVILSGSNDSSSLGPYGASPSVIPPKLKAIAAQEDVKLLDTLLIPDFNFSDSGYSLCIPYPDGETAVQAWIESLGTATTAKVGGSCPVFPGIGASDPGDFFATSVVAVAYLFSITPGDGVVELDFGDIMAKFADPSLPGQPPDYRFVSVDGVANPQVFVYSTAKGKITKLTQLRDFFFDGKPRPTEDDERTMRITSVNQGKFTINVRLDEDKTHAQIDNYGKTFQPYKVTFAPDNHDLNFDTIPDQPPPRLGK